MKWIGPALIALATLAAASVANAGQVYQVSFTSTIVPSGDWEYLDVQGIAPGGVPAVGILFTVPAVSSNPLLVLCDDLFQYVYVPQPYSPAINFDVDPLSVYHTGPLASDTSTLSGQQASELGQLVNQAQGIWNGGGTPGTEPSWATGLTVNQSIAAIQGAMWNIEYGKTVTSADGGLTGTAIDTAIDKYETEFANDYRPGALGLYSDPDGVQDQVLGFLPNPTGNGSPSPTPEPASWALMLLGVFLTGAVMRRRWDSPVLLAAPAA